MCASMYAAAGVLERAGLGFRRRRERLPQRVTQRHAVVVAHVEEFLERAGTGVDGRAHGARLEAAAFFVGPRDELLSARRVVTPVSSIASSASSPASTP